MSFRELPTFATLSPTINLFGIFHEQEGRYFEVSDDLEHFSTMAGLFLFGYSVERKHLKVFLPPIMLMEDFF